MNTFDQSVIDAVTQHMNGDHPEDNLLIAHAFGRPEATASTMVGLDGAAGLWTVTDPSGEHELSVPWPGGTIAERPEIRREVVALYQAACARLGVTPREEHAPEEHAAEQPHGAHAHGGGHGAHGHGPHAHGGHPHAHGGHPHAHGAAADDGSFSAELRAATWKDHGDSEHSTFMEDIMHGRADRADYAALVAQHYLLYEALEEASAQLAADERYAVFHPAELVRLPALEEDLELLLGEGWRARIEPVPATVAYVERIRELAEEGWKPGILAHHYTRYLGDLSGGQAIARVVARQHGFGRAGVAFYDFAALGPIPHFKKRYREALDALGVELSDEDRRRMVDEVREAYRFNTETFIDLGRLTEKSAA